MTILPRTVVPRGASLLGMRFGRLLVIAQVDHGKSREGTRWLVRCDCGAEKTMGRRTLVGGRGFSCGCWQRTAASMTHFRHGHANRSRSWRAWAGMKQRCLNPANPKYPDYGGRGIRVCERWLSFEGFLEDMGEKPDGMSLDRIDVNGNYEPGNCRWATAKEQCDNRRLSAPRVAQILDDLKAASSDLLERAVLDRVRVALLGS